jgi:hypothetical protein
MRATQYELNSLSELLSKEPPQIHQAPRTFFDIAGFAHYETVVSNFYAYYFNPQGEHGLGDVFLQALLSLVPENSPVKFMAWTDVEVNREVKTKQGNFIDLVIGIPSTDKPVDDDSPDAAPYTYKSAFIIENKVYAWLYNHIEDYYNSIHAHKKQGIVLSLRKEEINKTYFTSITHHDLITQVKELISRKKLTIDAREKTILEDFMQNLENMTKEQDLKAHMQFFHDNSTEIAQILQLRDEVSSALFQKVHNACVMLDLNLEIHSKKSPRLRHLWLPGEHVYFTVLLEDLFKGNRTSRVFIELDKDGITRVQEFENQEIQPKVDTSKVSITKVDKVSYMHYAELKLTPTVDDLNTFDQYLTKQIEESGLKAMFVAIREKLKTPADTNTLKTSADESK